MTKEKIFKNMESEITSQKDYQESTDIDVTPQEVMDYFTNNTTTYNTTRENKQETQQGKVRVLNDKGDIELKIPRKEWIQAGLDEETLKSQESATNPTETAPIPEIVDPLITNGYTQELLHSSVMSSTQNRMLYDLSKVTITDDEKEYYLRVVLENEPLELYITVGNKNKIGFNCKSKTIAIQNLITKLADVYITERDPNDKTQYKHSTFESGMYLLKLNAMFCLGGEGDEDGVKKPGLFKEIPLDLPFVEQQVIVEENNKIIDGLSFAKWNAIINILRIFEQKEALLGAELISGDF